MRWLPLLSVLAFCVSASAAFGQQQPGSHFTGESLWTACLKTQDGRMSQDDSESFMQGVCYGAFLQALNNPLDSSVYCYPENATISDLIDGFLFWDAQHLDALMAMHASETLHRYLFSRYYCGER